MTDPLATAPASRSDEGEPDMTARLFRGTTRVATVAMLGLVAPEHGLCGMTCC